uniref:TRASH domain-containing protein n=1 Tax=Ignisphaera aggregans TaxID=334771 RepID=A0A7C2VPV4_9CREN
MMTRKYECLVCGRIFHEGQGIKLNLAGREVYFHSKRCALKFFRSLVLYLDQKTLEQAVKMTTKEYGEKLRELKEKAQKNLEKL